MRLKEHPKIHWPLRWTERKDRSPSGEEGILRDVDLIDSSKLLLSKEVDGKTYLPSSTASTAPSLPGCTKKSSP